MSKVLWCFRCQREPDEDCEYCRYFSDNTYVAYVDDGDDEEEEDDA